MVLTNQILDSASKISLILAFLVGIATIIQLALAPFQFRMKPAQAEENRISDSAVLNLKPAASYLQAFSEHALFYIPQKKVAVRGPSLQDEVKSYQLSGIIQGAQPEVIIQNEKTNQTLFIRLGETFDGIEVTRIEANQVTVSKGTQTAQLVLERGIG